MSFDQELQVLIVGAGIGGLSVAGFFHQAGVEPVIIDADEEFGTKGGLVELWPDGIDVLRQLGLAEDIKEVGAPITTWLRRRPDGTVVDQWSTNEAVGFVAIPYERLRAQLKANIGERSIRTGTTLNAVESAEHPVPVTFENGVTEKFDVVIGADGVQSRTREILDGSSPITCETTSLTFPLPSDLTLRGANEILSPEGAVFRALPAGDRPIGALTVRNEMADTTQLNPVRAASRAPDIEWLLPDMIGTLDPDDVWIEDDREVQTDRWAEGYVALVGDAAHARHRLSGIGPMLALEDAAVLVSELLDQTNPLPTRLADYADRRQRRLNALLTRPDRGAGRPLELVGVPFEKCETSIFDIRGTQLTQAFESETATPAISEESPTEEGS